MNLILCHHFAREYFPHMPPHCGVVCVIIITERFLQRRTSKVEFANAADEQPELVEFENELSIQADGWAQLAPYGDFPGKGFRKKADGSVEKFSAIQRMDRAAATDMAAKFNSPIGKAKRFFSACPIYNGHPNTLTGKDKYPDKEPKGSIVALEARDNGLYCKPSFYNEAEPLLNQQTKIYFSGHWTSDELPKENGNRIFRPDKLKSAGLTPFPNLPVEHANEKEQTSTTETNMLKSLLISSLAALGIQFANDATDDQLIAGVNTLGAKAKTADTLATEKTQWANDKATLTGTVTARDSAIATLTTERDQHKTNFANERNSRIKGLLDGAITSGRITAAERPDWERRLNDPVQFANESEAISKVGSKVKTVSVLSDAGERKVEIANAADRSDAIRTLVGAEQKVNGGNYDLAFATVRKNNPALFAEMKQPVVTTK